MINQSLYADQQAIEEQYDTLEQLHLSGIGDALDGRLPQQAQVPHLEEFCEGMRLSMERAPKSINLPVINEEIKDYPLVCAQCAHLVDGFCGIKSVRRNPNRYACDQVLIDCIF